MAIENIKLLLLDVDGVLTDGKIIISDDGRETKEFDAHDGHGLRLFHRAGLQTALVSGRRSAATLVRARDLGIEHVHLHVHNKIEVFEALLQKLGLRPEEVCVVGDDVADMPIMRRCGYPVAVANARPEVKELAAYTTHAAGGHGAVREVIEKILKTQGLWDGVMARYHA